MEIAGGAAHQRPLADYLYIIGSIHCLIKHTILPRLPSNKCFSIVRLSARLGLFYLIL